MEKRRAESIKGKSKQHTPLCWDGVCTPGANHDMPLYFSQNVGQGGATKGSKGKSPALFWNSDI